MCNPVSWWLVGHGDELKLLISETTDSHTEAAAEFGIKDAGVGRVAAGEFWPDPASPSPDLTTWKLVWDFAGSDRKPAWIDAEQEAWLRAELERRCARYVFSSGTGHTITGCRAFVFKDACVEAYDSASVEAYDSASVEAYGSASVRAESPYAAIVFRKQFDGTGHAPVWCPHGGRGTYRATSDGYEVVAEEAARP